MALSHSGADHEAWVQDRVKAFGGHVESLKLFFRTFESPRDHKEPPKHHPLFGDRTYMNQLMNIRAHRDTDFQVHLDDLFNYFRDSKNPEVWTALLHNTGRYMQLLYEAADALLHADAELANTHDDAHADVESAKEQTTRETYMRYGMVPAYLRCTFSISLMPPKEKQTQEEVQLTDMRKVDADRVGKLSRMQVKVLSATQVKPRVQVAAYECDHCYKHVFQAVPASTFAPLSDCPGCTVQLGHKGSLKFNMRLSKFTNHQDVKVQEPASQVPEGDVPRSMSCVVLGAAVRHLQPGTTLTLSGVLLPDHQSALRSLRHGLVAEKKFHVYYVQNEHEEEACDLASCRWQRQVQEILDRGDVYNRLVTSLAPEVWDLTDVKKALLLQAVGCPAIIKPDGGAVRGDLHVLLMGDPGVAKSQLMKKMCTLWPRAVYTTGKGSSSAGLTAAIVKDPNTGETDLEGGAFVLADQGLCCVDEFDKMDEYDRCAIYEVMEQQTVSIAKAGHCVSMAARAAVLAAANPLGGSYDLRKSLFINMNLPAALLTRFDVVVLLLDRADREADGRLARHILRVMRGTRAAEKDRDLLTRQQIIAVIANAKKVKPKIPRALADMATAWYANARQSEKTRDLSEEAAIAYTTPRALLAVLRMSQALARIRTDPIVSIADFEEAVRLMESSKATLLAATDRVARKPADVAPTVFNTIKRLKKALAARPDWDGWIRIDEIEERTSILGVKRRAVERKIVQYEELGVIVCNAMRTKLAFPEDAANSGDASTV